MKHWAKVSTLSTLSTEMKHWAKVKRLLDLCGVNLPYIWWKKTG